MVRCKPFPKGIFHRNFVECHFFVRDSRIVIGKAYISQIQPFSSVESSKFIIAETSRNFPCPVRPEVKENHGIFVFYGCYRSAVFYYNGRFYKFVRFSSFIRLRNGCRTSCCSQPFPFGKGIIRQFYPVVIVVPVHSIVTAHHRRHFPYADFFHLIFQFFYKAFAAFRRGIPAV